MLAMLLAALLGIGIGVPTGVGWADETGDGLAVGAEEDPPSSWPVPEGLTSEAHLLIEAASGQALVAVNADERRPVASTLKLLTAYSVITRVPLDEEVTVGQEVLVGGSGLDLAPGETWTVKQLLLGLLPRSGNDAAEALAVHVGGDRETFLRMMEEDAVSLGIQDPIITTPSGLDDDTLLSARELGVIARAVLEFEELREIIAEPQIILPDREPADNRNELLEMYPTATGMKTGFTTLAGHGLVASARDGGRELIAIVLGADEDPDRFEQAISLLDHGFERTSQVQVSSELMLDVGGGKVRYHTEQLTLTVPDGFEARFEVSVPTRVSDELRVPLMVGDETITTVTAIGPTPQQVVTDTGGEQAELGRSLVGGVYAALRAAAGAGMLG